MSFWTTLLNDIAVSYFGSILSASFCEALNTRKNKIIFWVGTVLMLVPVGIIFRLRGVLFLRNIYPLLIHFPLLVLLWILTGKLLWSLISILSAYLCCE
ncbi:MAG: histidine kinase, partial [Clostridiales bacterium]|nr:histidine kinase [Clostridiales bacterium]